MSKTVRVNPISEFAPRDQSTCGPNQYTYCYQQNLYPKDPDRLNCYIEKDGDHIRVFKRPGKAVIWALDVNASQGQGMTMFNGVPFAVVFDNPSVSEALVFPAGPPNSGTDGTAWTSSSVGPWAIRNYPVCVIFNNQIVVIGGQLTGGAAGTNDVWATSDGITWNQLGVIPFGFRWGYNGCVFNGAIYLFGGVSGGVYQNDVWMSTDGVNWTQIALTSPWAGRALMGVISTSAGMYIIGGSTNSGQLNDVWFSTGWAAIGTAAATIGWQQQTGAASWSVRANMMCWSFNNTLFMGGGVNVVTSQNDVWSSTNGGISWTQLTAAAWATGIDSGSALVYNNKLWMLGGQNFGVARSSAIYSSPDGITWSNIGSVPGGAKEGMGAVVFQVPASVSTGRYQTMWLMGGDTGTFQNTTYRANLNTTLTNVYPLNPNSFNQDRYDFASFSNNTQLLIKSTAALFVADQGGVQRVFDSSYPPVTVPGIVVLGDSAYVMDPTGLIFGSPNSNPYIWPPVNRIAADYESDPGVAITKYLSYLVAFGTYTTQFFYDAGVSPGSALLPYLASSLKIGCFSAATVQSFDNTVIWVSQNKEGYRQVMMFNGLQAVPISTPGIEKMITAVRPSLFSSDVIMYANHSFYLLTVVTSNTNSVFAATKANTMVYDLTSKEWVRWENSVSDVEGFGFMMGGSSTNLSYAGQNSYFLSPENGNVYSLGSLYADNAGIYAFALQSAKFDGGNNTNKFWGPMELIGDKLAGSVNIQYTDDDYITWSPARAVDMNTPRPILYTNGQSRRRAVTLTQIDDKPRVIEYMEYPNVEQGE